MTQQATEPAQKTTDAGNAVDQKESILTAEQLHEQAVQATEAYEKEQDPDKKTELWKTAKETVVKAKETYAAEKKSAKEAAEKAAQEANKSKAPEKYELKLPENSPLSAASIDKISSYAKEKGLSNDAAQAILERESQAVAEYRDSKMAELEETSKGWLETAKTDKEIGGEAFKQNAELAKRVVDRYGDKEFKEALNSSGFGNHPGLVKLLVRVGKQMSSDQLVIPGTQETKPQIKTAAERLYGGTTAA